MFLFTSTFLGLVVLTLGITLLFQTFFKIKLPSVKALLAFILIYFGIALMATELRFIPSKKNEPDLKTIIFQENTIVMHNNPEAIKTIDLSQFPNPNFEFSNKLNTDYNIIFARGTLDFNSYKIDRGNIYLEVNSAFSKSEIIIRKNMAIRIIINPAFAIVSYPDGKAATPLKRSIYYSSAYSHNTYAITIRANVTFSSLNIIEK
ncbi:MAG: hypothetical protein H7A25_21815 [Leptospiraceae bacterium]|nr:hypothetical protein [Leptospiraceae bacterium]MCP5502551.1 hypothetical protein [Leptospiraceae bacterium]